MNCRNCGKFTGKTAKGKTRLHCNSICMGLAMRGKSRTDRQSPSRKAYIQIRLEDGSREYLHRFRYRMENGEIPEGFVVHHKDEVKRNNEPENLKALPRNEHTPNAHYHWKTRDWREPGRYVPLSGEESEELSFWQGNSG